MTREYIYNVVIVGAGPAGASLAYFLSKNNIDGVAIIDSRGWNELWSKPCGNAIGKHHFTKHGIPEPTGKELLQKISGVYILSPNEKVKFIVKGEGYIIERRLLGERLLREATERGVEFYSKTTAVKPIIENGFVAGVEAVCSGEKILFKSKIVVDATGTSGLIRRKIPGDNPIAEPLDPRDSNIAFRERIVLPYDISNPDYIRIYLDQTVAPGGYWWFFPEGVNRANVGLGVQGGVGNPNPKILYKEKILRRKELLYRRVLNAGGAQVPTRRPLDTLVWNGLIAIGDSGFTVNPVHGGGMGYAITAAYYASKAIEDALEKGNYSMKALWSLNVNYMRELGAKQASLDLARIFMQNLGNEGLQFIMEKKLVREEDVDLLSRSGELEYSTAEKAVRIVQSFIRILKAASKPTLLLKMKSLASYMKKIKTHYINYPSNPEDLDRWRIETKRIINEFINNVIRG